MISPILVGRDYTDSLGKQKKGTTFTYRVCQAGTEFCSPDVTAEIGVD